jgi:ABC-type multidrug transport system permease subunit
MSQFKSFDLAEGSFVEKWPIWLRWTLFIPAAFIGSLIAVILIGLLNNISMNYIGATKDGWAYKLFELAQSGVLGALFVLFGATVIPKGQFIASIVFLIIAVLISVLSFLGNAGSGNVTLLLALLHSLAVIIGGGYAVYLCHKEEPIYGNN